VTPSEAGRAVWITWESQPRNLSMARELGVTLHIFDFQGSRASRQLRAAIATVRVLLATRPSVVFASNPSLVLTFLLLVFRSLLRFRFVSDAHYGGVVSVSGNGYFQWLLDFVNRRADLVIVTNAAHEEYVRRIGGTPFVCPDPLPRLPESATRPIGMREAEKSVLFICSYDPDEPYAEVFEAARRLEQHGFRVFASGRYARAGLSPSALPHAVLLGFVDRATYDAYLQNVDVVLDLTTWQDCLVCGAYEAMAAGKPCVLSKTRALTDLFTHGTVFSSHDPAEIAQAVLTAYERRGVLRAQIAEWVERHQHATRNRIMALRAAVRLPAAGV
jgi:glycosyltransferase involved in cell wall biosynthesis